jgi:hypothetical protein
MEARVDCIEKTVVGVAGVLPEHHAAETIIADVERFVRERFCVLVVHPGLGVGVVEIGSVGAVVEVAHVAGAGLEKRVLDVAVVETKVVLGSSGLEKTVLGGGDVRPAFAIEGNTENDLVRLDASLR